jgi:sugar O-acyltransferase (sialic acid O-acetyltransferase NeuD family)
MKSSNNISNLVILGAGGFAREVAWLISDINKVKNTWNIMGLIENGTENVGKIINGIPIIDPDILRKRTNTTYAIAAIGNPRIKERAIQQAKKLGCLFTTLIHPSVTYDDNTVTFGEGSIVCAHSIFTTNIKIGSHVIVNLDCTIGHDCLIEDYVTISPGCHLSGHTYIRHHAFLGTGCVTIENHEIGKNSIIGAGAVVINDIPANNTAIGIPAKTITKRGRR